MDTKELQALEEKLRARMRELEEEIRRDFEKADRKIYVSASEVHDSAERSFADQLVGLELAEADRDLTELRAVYAALQRMKSGTYGTCVACGSPIDDARLRALPAAARCRSCEEQREADASDRPVPR